MILYRWKHRGGSSLNKFPALNTVHFAIFDDVKSPYYALETIFTVYHTSNGPILGKFWVKIGYLSMKIWWIILSQHGSFVWPVRMCGPLLRSDQQTDHTGRDGGFQQVFHGFISMWSNPSINVKLKWYFLIEKLNRQKVINHNYFPMI